MDLFNTCAHEALVVAPSNPCSYSYSGGAKLRSSGASGSANMRSSSASGSAM
jgi:hypothetical protein